MSIPCILIPAIVGLVSGALGYLLGSSFGAKSGDNSANLSLQSDLDACRANTKSLNTRIASLEADLSAAKASAAANVQSFAASVATASAGVAAMVYDGDASFNALGKKWKQDDLKIVEGIGPKIEELYHNAGIKTWKQLSETAVEKSQQILDAAGERYKIHNPSTWAKQAEMCYLGKWSELKAWQDSLDGGKE
jgi:predicted flap endonuclease-1-like 5' DNA nuclease